MCCEWKRSGLHRGGRAVWTGDTDILGGTAGLGDSDDGGGMIPAALACPPQAWKVLMFRLMIQFPEDLYLALRTHVPL